MTTETTTKTKQQRMEEIIANKYPYGYLRSIIENGTVIVSPEMYLEIQQQAEREGYND